jgi:adenine phosphoribosyltransferase
MPSEYLKLIDHQTQGPRCDVTPLFADYQAFAALVEDLMAQMGDIVFDIVAGIDALGFILGTALAVRSRAGFVPIRKGGKLPVAVDAAEFVDYSGRSKSLELRRDAITPDTRVLVVDEWIETGAQVSAAIHLLEARGAIIAGIASIRIDTNERTERLLARYPCFSVLRDE